MKRLLVLAVSVLCGVYLSVAQERSHHHGNHSDEKHKKSMAESVEPSKWNGVHISFVNSKHDFGDVPSKGGDLKVKFEYVNDGIEPLIITRIATSCTCIRTDCRRRPLDVGESAVIELTYEPHKMEAGTFHKAVQVYSNSVDGMHLLTVSGNSVEKR